MASPESPELAKVERLAIAGEVAPVLRRRAGAPRKVTLVGKDGKPTGITTDVEVAKSLLARSEIEFSVQDGKRPEFVKCVDCGLPVKVSKKGPIPRKCLAKTHRCKCGRPVGSSGVCGFGRMCSSCNARHYAVLARTVAKSTGALAKRRRFSDAQLREVAATGVHARAAARALGVEESVVRKRALGIGITFPDGRRTCELPPRERVVTALVAANGNVTEAARLFGIGRMVLERHVDALGMREWLTAKFPPKDRIRIGAQRAGKARRRRA